MLFIPVVLRGLSSDACTAEVHPAALQNCATRPKSRMGDKAVVPKDITEFSCEKQMLSFTNQCIPFNTNDKFLRKLSQSDPELCLCKKLGFFFFLPEVKQTKLKLQTPFPERFYSVFPSLHSSGVKSLWGHFSPEL